jgi:hypothetical protein
MQQGDSVGAGLVPARLMIPRYGWKGPGQATAPTSYDGSIKLLMVSRPNRGSVDKWVSLVITPLCSK